MPYALALRHIYTYETKSGKKLINWGVKKSLVDRETEEFKLCGIRVKSNPPLRKAQKADVKIRLSEFSNSILAIKFF